jgi:tetratricopeptide (TPR) repeat protein
MARRVNTKFLILLVSFLMIAIAVIAGIWLYVNKFENNPHRLEAQAAQALKAGHVTTAIKLYQRAALVLAHSGSAKLPALYLKLGTLFYNSTSVDPSRFGKARGFWQAAIEKDPKNLKALKLMLHLDDSIARATHQPSDWAVVLKAAEAVLALDPKDATALRLRGLAEISSKSQVIVLTNHRYVTAEKYLKKAAQIDPQNEKCWESLAQLYFLQAEEERSEHIISPQQAAALRQKGIADLHQYVVKHPRKLRPWLTLWTLSISTKSLQSTAAAYLAAARKINPKSPLVASADLKLLLIHHASLKAIQHQLNVLIASDPSNGQNYYLAGKIMAQFGDNPAAVKYFVAGLKHPKPGEGIIPLLNKQLRSNTHQSLVDCYLALASGYPAGSPQRTRYVHLAIAVFRPIQQAHPNLPWVYVRQGEVRYVQGRLNSALRWLHKGAANLSPNNAADRGLWVQDKQIQAQIYDLLGQSGSALHQINEIADRVGESPVIELKQAALLVQQNPRMALAHANAVLIADPGNPAATFVKATALGELGDTDRLASLLAKVHTDHDQQMAVLKARFELMRHNYAMAQRVIAPWLKRYPSAPQIVRLAYGALAGMGDRRAAIAVVDAALKGEPDNLQFLLLNHELNNSKAPMPLVIVPSLVAPIEFQFSGKTDVQAELTAIRQLKNPLQRDMLLARYYLALKNDTKALDELRAARKAAPHNTQITALEFQIALEQKNFKRASALVTRAAAQNADGAGGDLFRADLLEARGNFTGAMKIIRRLMAKNPDSAALQAAYGKILLQTGNVREGIAQLQAALQKKPNQVDAITSIVQYYLSNPSVPHLKEAMALVNQGITYDPTNIQFVRWSHQIQDIIGNPAPEILRRRAILKAQPNNLGNIVRLALLYVRVHRITSSIDLLRSALKSHPDNLRIASVLGKLYIDHHQFSHAEAVFSNLAEAANRQVAFAGRMLLASYYQSRGAYQNAVQMYESAAKAEPSETLYVQQRLADLYYATGHLKKSLGLYDTILKKYPDNRSIILRVVQIKVRLGNSKSALSMLNRQILRANPHDEQALVLKGYAYLKENRLNASLKAIDAALALNPRDPHALIDQALLKMSGSNPDYTTAVSDLLGVIAENPNNLQARAALASAYVSSHHFDEAVLEYRKIVSLAPDDAIARNSLLSLLYQLANDLKSVGPNDQSGFAAMLRRIDPVRLLTRTISQAIKLDSKNPDWLLWQARLYGLTGHQNQAIQSAHEAYIAANRNLQSAVAYLQVLIDYKQYQTAEAVASRSLAVNPNVPGLYLARALAQSGLGKEDASAKSFEKVLQLTHDRPIAFLQAAGTFDQVMSASHHADTVNSALSAMLTTYPKSAPLIDMALAEIDLSNKQYSDTINYADAAVKGLQQAALKAQAYTAAAVALYQEAHYRKSAKMYAKALKLAPNDTQVLNNYAYTLGVKLKKPFEGVKLAEKANSILANEIGASTFCREPSVLDTLGWLRYKTGDMSGAIAAFGQCIALEGATPEMYLHYGKVLAADKRLVRAKRVLEEGLALAEKSKSPMAGQISTFLAHLGG